MKQVVAVLRNFLDRVGDGFETRGVTRDHVQGCPLARGGHEVDVQKERMWSA